MRKIDRFSKYMEYKGLNDNIVTKECSLAQGLLGKARSGRSDIGSKAIDKILEIYTDINQVWLLTGYGEMLKTETESPKPEDLHLNDLIKAQAETINSQKLLISTLFEKIERLQRALEERG